MSTPLDKLLSYTGGCYFSLAVATTKSKVLGPKNCILLKQCNWKCQIDDWSSFQFNRHYFVPTVYICKMLLKSMIPVILHAIALIALYCTVCKTKHCVYIWERGRQSDDGAGIKEIHLGPTSSEEHSWLSLYSSEEYILSAPLSCLPFSDSLLSPLFLFQPPQTPQLL